MAYQSYNSLEAEEKLNAYREEYELLLGIYNS
jgi:hypothetical protein